MSLYVDYPHFCSLRKRKDFVLTIVSIGLIEKTTSSDVSAASDPMK